MGPRCQVIVMAKAPRAGLAKTRLAPALGADGAARLAHRLLDHALAQALAAGVGPVELCAAPCATDPAFDAFRDRPLQWTDQGEGDLGARMARALARALADGPRALLIGTDAPAIDAATLRAAAAALSAHDAVFVPALDGGYALMGVARPAAELFDGIAWSTPQVMAATRERLRVHGWTHAELAPVADIDEPADLVHLPAGWARELGVRPETSA
jgi:rSAM/selenodomain-associated transferase 1